MLTGIKISVCIVLLASCVSCKRSMAPADYAAYVTGKENGLKKTTQVDGMEFIVQYRPADYIVLMENRGSKNPDGDTGRKAQLKGSAWFNVSIKRADNSISVLKYGIRSLEEYNERLNYYLNGAINDIKLVYGSDTLHPSSYVFENNYNLAPQETMVVGFTLPEGRDMPEQDMRLSMVDRVFNNGIINASFPVKILKNIPALNY